MPNDIKKLRRLMKSANILKKSDVTILRGGKLNASQSLKYAWWFENFRNKLATGIYRFSYFKKDGTIREAVGTLCLDFIPYDQHPKGRDTEPNYDSFAYYDEKAEGWRSFRLDNFIGFIEKVDENGNVIG